MDRMEEGLMTPEHRKHLTLLADALEKRDPKLFDMLSFARDEKGSYIKLHQVVEHRCGAICCALGTAPLVDGIPRPLSEETWFDYGERVFGINEGSPTWKFLFNASWTFYFKHNTSIAAARRIRYYLETDKSPSMIEWVQQEKVLK